MKIINTIGTTSKCRENTLFFTMNMALQKSRWLDKNSFEWKKMMSNANPNID